MNILEGRVVVGRVEIEGVGTLLAACGAGPGGVAVGVRPNGFEVSARAGDNGVAGMLVGQEYLGSESFLEVRLNNRALVVVQEHPDHGWKMSQELRLPSRAGNLHLFNS
jgi:multiple sugar transport system ATP-binding protein